MKLESEGQLSLAQSRQLSRTRHAGSDQDWDFHADTVHRDSGGLGGSSLPLWEGTRRPARSLKSPDRLLSAPVLLLYPCHLLMCLMARLACSYEDRPSPMSLHPQECIAVH